MASPRNLRSSLHCNMLSTLHHLSAEHNDRDFRTKIYVFQSYSVSICRAHTCKMRPNCRCMVLESLKMNMSISESSLLAVMTTGSQILMQSSGKCRHGCFLGDAHKPQPPCLTCTGQ